MTIPNHKHPKVSGSSISEPEPRVLYEKCNEVAYITLNRPHLLNAMDEQMHDELGRVWNDFEHDNGLRVGVLTGSGERAFSVGQDLKELVGRVRAGAPSSSFGSVGRPGWPRLTERFALTKPIIARVNGLALGGGFELALACDIIVASDQACFALPEARLGLIPGAGGLFRLTRQIPYKAAMGYLMTGRHISAMRAYELGLVNEVVTARNLDVCVKQWAEDIIRCAPLSLRALKQVSLASMHLPLDAAFAGHYEMETLRSESEDSKEGPLAFVEKRPPRWKAQ